MNLSLYSIPNLLVGICCIVLGLFIVIKTKKTLITFLVSLYFICTPVWLICYGLAYNISDPSTAIITFKIGHLAPLIYTPTTYLICILLSKRYSEIKYCIATTLVSIYLIYLSFSGSTLYIVGVRKYFWGNMMLGTQLMGFYALFTIIVAVRALYLLFYTYKHNSLGLDSRDLNKLKYFMLAFVAFAFSLIDYLSKLGVPIYPIGFFPALIFLAIMAYAILKHNLMDINIVFRKGILYSALLTVITVIYLFLIIFLEKISKNLLGYSSPFVSYVALIFLLLTFHPLKNRIQSLLDKYFFKGSISQINEENIKLRDELQKTEKMKAIGTLAAGMAHEIKNPLTSIKTFTEYLNKKKNEPGFIEKYEHLIGKEVDRINYIVTELLEFSKPTDLKLQKTNINALLDETLDLLSNDFISKNIKVEKKYTDIPHIKVDPNQMKQVFLNLFLNAKDAMPDGGTLSITTTTVDSNFIISIYDSGKGISKEDLKHIFDPFFTKKDGGTGLGLSVVHGIMEKHGGKIGVKSELKNGTEITIQLPYTS